MSRTETAGLHLVAPVDTELPTDAARASVQVDAEVDEIRREVSRRRAQRARLTLEEDLLHMTYDRPPTARCPRCEPTNHILWRRRSAVRSTGSAAVGVALANLLGWAAVVMNMNARSLTTGLATAAGVAAVAGRLWWSQHR